MKLKKKIAKLADVETHLQALYTEEEEGGFTLNSDKALEFMGSRVAEFRTNNITLKKEQEEQAAKLASFKDIDPVEYAKAQERLKVLDKLEEDDLLKDGDIDALVQKRVSTHAQQLKEDYEARLKEAQKTIEETTTRAGSYKNKLDEALIDSGILTAVHNIAVPRKGAIDDIKARARRHWSVNDEGDLVSKDLFDSNGDPVTDPKEYAPMLVQQAGYLFEPGGGGNAGGANGKKGDDKVKWIENTPLETGRHAAAIAAGDVKVRGLHDSEG